MNSFYVVCRGRRIGIYDSWKKCSEYTYGFPDAIYKKCDSIDESIEFAEEHMPKDYQYYNILVGDLHRTCNSYETFKDVLEYYQKGKKVIRPIYFVNS